MIGCAGDANPYPRGSLDLARAHGEALGKEVCRVLDMRLQPVHGPLHAVFGKAEPVVTPLNDPFVQRIAKIAEAYNGKPPSITPIVGGTLPLLGALQRYVGLPGLCAPGNPTYWANGAHAPNEHIRLADLDQAVHFNCYMFQALA